MTRHLDPWTTLDREVVYAAAPWVTVLRERVLLPTGRVIDDFYRVELPDFAVATPIRPDGRIVLVRGYKHGLKQVTLSPPAGLIQPGEAPLEAAQRELLEETGYRAAEWVPLGRFVVDGNRQCGTLHLFQARGAVRVAAPAQDDSEPLEVVLMQRAELLRALQGGQLGNLAGAGAVALSLVLGDHALVQAETGRTAA